MIANKLYLSAIVMVIGAMIATTNGFSIVPVAVSGNSRSISFITSSSTTSTAINMSDEISQESPDDTQARIKELIKKHPVLLFMKGSKLFPQCGFSNTATQILNSFNIDFHTVDVLSDEKIRQGIKTYSNWPTIPQLYVAGEFLGGSDIMIEMYQSGELGEMIEKAKADMV